MDTGVWILGGYQSDFARNLTKEGCDFADLTREARPADFTPVEINALAESVRRAAAAYANQAEVSLHVSLAPSELWIWGDRYLLERATLNLMRNAIEASPRGGAVRLRR